MSLFLAKKQEENNQKKVRSLLSLKDNRKCFDCPTKSPTFVNTTIQTFVCARCSGLVREAGHRVKAVSASKFSGAELIALQKGGNGVARKIWLSNYSTHDAPEPESDNDVRAFIRQKYYENKWLDAALLYTHKEEVRALISKSFTEDGLPIVSKSRSKMSFGFSRVPLIADGEMNIMQGDDDEFEQITVKGHQHPISVVPEYTTSTSMISPPPPMTVSSPVATDFPRSSMESSYSSFSSSSRGSSGLPNHDQRGSLDTNRSNSASSKSSSITSNRQSIDSSYSSTSSTEIVLTAEQIAERCRSSIESDNSKLGNTTAPTTPQPQTLDHYQHGPHNLSYQQDAYSHQQGLHSPQYYNQYPQQQPEPCNSYYQHQQPYVERQGSYSSQYQNQQEEPNLSHESQYQQQDPYTPPPHYRHHQQESSYFPPQQQPVITKQTQFLSQEKPSILADFSRRIPLPAQAQALDNKGLSSASASPSVTPSTSSVKPIVTPSTTKSSAFDSILSDLAGLKLEKTVRRATYTGGLLSPAAANTPLQPSVSESKASNEKNERPASMFDTDFFAKLNKKTEQQPSANDPYAALRGIATPVKTEFPPAVKDDEKHFSSFSSSEDDDDEEDPWQEFCSSSTTNGNDSFLEPAQVVQPVVEEPKTEPSMITMDLFSDLDPRSMFKRF